MSDAPTFRVVSGTPTAEELAAVVVVLTARSRAAGGQAPTAAPDSAWASYWTRRPAPLSAGDGAWRASALPR